MIKVKLSTDFPYEPIIRQTPGRRGIWDECQFYINSPVNDCDYWVVYNEVSEPETAYCPRQNTILITGEPPSILDYPATYTSQFARVVTCHRHISHPRLILNQTGLSWHTGRVLVDIKNRQSITNRDYDDFKDMHTLPKSKLMSVITSSKDFTEGHQKRLNFVRRLKDYFGEDIDVFGRGIREVDDKWDALSPYKYHIALENSVYPHYWTEKLSDVYLSGAYPIYYGCPNLEDYFPAAAYTRINIDDVEGAIRTIEECIRERRYEASLDRIIEARNLVLDHYNLFALIAELVREPVATKKKIVVTAGQSVSSVVSHQTKAKARISFYPQE
ncbi:MAG: glycosyltransferase family 10 [Syntrophomonadaceae bacterium]|nr:glycosyltransferase family 10 [Syntrophomonadaceae bacterium]